MSQLQKLKAATTLSDVARRRYVFNVDLRDFFGAINFGRVRGLFLKDKNFALEERVATVIAQIACHDNRLPHLRRDIRDHQEAASDWR